MKSVYIVFMLLGLSICWQKIAGWPVAGASQPATVSEKDGLYTLSAGNNRLTVASHTGGRIISFTCNGKELLLPSAVHDVNYGATLWPSPQCDWGWPPYPVLDTGPYLVSFEKDVLSLESRPDSVSGFLFQKKFSASSDSAIDIEYAIYNISGQDKLVAAWDVCRTYGGISFFPAGEGADLPESTLNGVSMKDGIVWYHFSKDSLQEPQKLFATAKEGWLAHFTDGLLFVKKFPDTKVSELSPQQGEVELFAQKEGLYIELENHGPYTTLKPGEHLTYHEKWFLKEVRPAPSLVQLVEMVRQLVK